MGGDVCYEKSMLTYKGLISTKIYESFKDYKAVYVKMSELDNLNNSINNIHYLIGKGIFFCEVV